VPSAPINTARPRASEKNTIIGTDELYLVQQDGSLPTTLAAGSALGESGVSVLRTRFRDGVHFSATPRQHLIWFQLSKMRIECRRAGRRLTQEVLFWNDAASAFIGRLAARHTSGHESQWRGRLGKRVLERLRDYIITHLDEPIEVAALADLAGRSRYHFSRVFSRSVGISPHRYVVHLRLQRALELIRDGRSSLAEIAAQTGFADQSHLSRWVRRVHGVPLTQVVL